ncbi:uncharacterized protein GGS22DRAFT_153954 [Annulohypoxylon maeteangense]|uniref:uncharacterized protein n=1 Tax=Annulohypoxylon maeteangense TaxID=1927788 RepID=UPI002007534B|nr:uncharacterized protein GGS22DRAFT_153954 [Annulohypoxylon maeteangense]KAI0889463.1 hypothetical protein GGS22DRAFT_153954 [Annulohypoxylon maeteangense]
MSRSLLRTALELRTPITRLPPPFLLPLRARAFSSTPEKRTIEPATPASEPNPRGLPITPTRRGPPPPPPPSTQGPSPITSPSVAELFPLLRAQPSHYITVHIHERPYLVTEGDRVRLPFLMHGVLPGDILRLDRASTIGSRDYTLLGQPYIDSGLFECRATVLGVESEPLRVKIKTKRRNRRSQRVTSKHRYTILRISELKLLGPT